MEHVRQEESSKAHTNHTCTIRHCVVPNEYNLRNKKLLVTSALLVVTMFAIRNNKVLEATRSEALFFQILSSFFLERAWQLSGNWSSARSNQVLLFGPNEGLGTRFATRNKCHASSNRCLTSSNKKLLGTSATLVVTGALLVVTRSY